jgi:hypothetical protein
MSCHKIWDQFKIFYGYIVATDVNIPVTIVSSFFIDYCSYYTWCGYEVHGMTLMLKLKGATWLHHSEDLFVHVSVNTTYNFNALTPVCVEVMVLIRCVSMYHHKNEWSVLEQLVSITFCLILGRMRHLFTSLQSLQERSYEKVKCFWVAYTVQRMLTCQN